MRPARSSFVAVRDLHLHVRCWGPTSGPAVMLLHGWMDGSASFQFVADALPASWRLLAPDWRGFGRSDPAPGHAYWFPDYLADLDALVSVLGGGDPVRLVGHSMGGNLALLYAGIRPERVEAVVNLEGFGLREPSPDEAPARYARWLDELGAGAAQRGFASTDELAARLVRRNPRLAPERARFLAAELAVANPEGGVCLAADPAHRYVNPVLYRFAEVAACWRRIRCPVLWMQGTASTTAAELGVADELDRRRAVIRDLQAESIADAGHMLHHDQPEAVARSIVAFFAARCPRRD